MTEIQKVIDEAVAEIEQPKKEMERAVQAQPLTKMEALLAVVLIVGLPVMLMLAGAKIVLGCE